MAPDVAVLVGRLRWPYFWRSLWGLLVLPALRAGDAVIDRQGLKILFECDTCDEVWESEDREEFDDAWARARTDGWSARKIANEWMHGCPHCGAPT